MYLAQMSLKNLEKGHENCHGFLAAKDALYNLGVHGEQHYVCHHK